MRRPSRRHDALDDAQEVGLAVEGERGAFDLAVALDVDLMGPVDHDLGYTVIAQQPIERAIAQDLGDSPLEELLALTASEDKPLLAHDLGIDISNLAPDHLAVGKVLVRTQGGNDAVPDKGHKLPVSVGAGAPGARNLDGRGLGRSRGSACSSYQHPCSFIVS